MKKTRIMAIIGLLALFCVGCTSKATDYTASSEEILVPDDVEVPDAASTVEKLINNEDVLEIPDMDEEALEKLESEAKAAENVKTVDVDIYYVFGSYDNFQVDNVELTTEFTAEDIVEALAGKNIVPIDCKVVDFKLEENDSNTKVLYLDLSKSFKTYLTTMSEDASEAIINSVVNTFLKAFDADEMYLSIEGESVISSDENESALQWASKPVSK